MSPAQHQELLALLKQYADLFATEDDPLGRTSMVKHTIHTESPTHSPASVPLTRGITEYYKFRGTENALAGNHPAQF